MVATFLDKVCPSAGEVLIICQPCLTPTGIELPGRIGCHSPLHMAMVATFPDKVCPSAGEVLIICQPCLTPTGIELPGRIG